MNPCPDCQGYGTVNSLAYDEMCKVCRGRGWLPGQLVYHPEGICVICLQLSSRSVCDGCESTGGLFGDWRSDCGWT